MVFLILVQFRPAIAASWLDPVGLEILRTKKRFSIAFASQNMRTPASLFGHTFIIAHDEIPLEPDAVILEFLGNTTDSNFSHVRALFGSIPGYFKLTNYQQKKREFEMENRDIWLYELKLADSERQKLLAEIENELNNNSHRYNFIGANCSYYIFNILRSPYSGTLGEGKFYTIPAQTIRELREREKIKGATYIPSEEKKLTRSLANLTARQREDLDIVLGGYKPETVPSFHDDSFRIATSMMINYKIPREPDPKMRREIFNLKKEFHQSPGEGIVSARDPSLDPSEGSVDINFSPPGGTWMLGFRPAQRDFYSSEHDGLQTSEMEVGKLQIGITERSIELSQLSIFRMETYSPGTDFTDPFNRYLDLSYRSWHFETSSQAEETYLRFGIGASIEFGSLRLGVMPYLGLRYYAIDSAHGLRGDFGVKAILNHWLSRGLRYQLRYTYYIDSPFKFSDVINLDLLFFRGARIYLYSNAVMLGSFEKLRIAAGVGWLF